MSNRRRLPLTPNQDRIVGRLEAGEDLRTYHLHHSTFQSLARHRVVDIEAATCRLRLRPTFQNEARQ